MRIFLSWSGPRSKAVATALRDWLPLVFHFAQPWMSDKDIDAGERWSIEIGKELESSNFGIICLTRENLAAPWILFEAGALSKQFVAGRIVPYLLDVELGALSGPLSQFQAKKAEREATQELVRAINAKSESAIPEPRLATLFELAWPRLEVLLAQVPAAVPETRVTRPTSEVLEELVAAVRSFDHRLAVVELRGTSDAFLMETVPRTQQPYVSTPTGAQPFIFTKATIRNSVHHQGNAVTVDVYHEVVARQECGRFHHSIDTGMDRREAAQVKLVAEDAYDIEALHNPGNHAVTLEFERITPKEIAYFVNVDPPLVPGERLGYRRAFTINCLFPLKRAELLQIAAEDGFPALYRVDDRPWYGDFWDVLSEMDSVTLSIHFPRRVGIKSTRALVVSLPSKIVNASETDRCNSAHLTLRETPEVGERMLSLTVRRPLINHQYVLLYEPE